MKPQHTPSELKALKDNHNLQVECAKRYEAFCVEEKVDPPERIDILMTLHYADKDCGMDFAKLLLAPDFDFLHDMSGLLRHMNRQTCKIGNCFLPRCSLSS